MLVDGAMYHRLGVADETDVREAMRRERDKLNAMLGSLLFAWLPKQAIDELELPICLGERGALRAGYGGVFGLRIGCKSDDISFDTWIGRKPLKWEVCELIAVEYPNATHAFSEDCRLSPSRLRHRKIWPAVFLQRGMRKLRKKTKTLKTIWCVMQG